MASVIGLPPQSFNPLLAGIGVAQGLGDLSRQGLQLGAMRQTMPGQIAAQNAQSQATANTAVPMANSRLGLMNAQIPATQANTERTIESTRLMPEQAKTALLNSIINQGKLSQSQNRFGPLYNWKQSQQSLTPAGKANYQRENPQLTANVTQGAANIANNFVNAGGQSPHVAQNPLISSLTNSIGASLGMNVPVNQSNDAQQPAYATQPHLGGNPNNLVSGNYPYADPKTVQAIQQASQNQYIKDTTPAKIQEQRYYSGIAGGLYNQASPLISSVSKYSGYSGGFDKLLQAGKSGTGGVTPQDYQDLLNFKQSAPVIANEIRRQLGGQATDAEARVMGQLVDPSLWNKSPQQVMGLWHNLGAIINTSGSVLKKSQSQIASGLGNEANIGGVAPPSQATNKLTPNAPLKSAPLKSITSFKSKQDFQNWYSGLSPSKQAQVRAHLGG